MTKYKSNLKDLLQKHKIKSISANSNDIEPNSAFFAIRGNNIDANQYIPYALKKGAKIVFTDSEQEYKQDNIIKVPNVRKALAEAANIIYPLKPKYLVGVTGTNGKSSVVSYFRQIIASQGRQSASIGTLGLDISHHIAGLEDQDLNLTSPDPVVFNKLLHALKEHDVDYVAFEASSHALDQYRTYGNQIIAAGFTSFSRDHLDYHLNSENYLAAKLKLFDTNLIAEGKAFINGSIFEKEYIKNYITSKNRKVITIGSKMDVNIRQESKGIHGQEVSLQYNGKLLKFYTNIIGSFQSENIVMALLLAEACGLDITDLTETAHLLKAPKGRLEMVSNLKDGPYVFIDYAHSPDALERVLLELIKIKTGRIILVFGCGGNRDQGKRKVMGEISSRLADVVIVTDDNPRDENPQDIRGEILSKVPKGINIGDRKEAIKYGLSLLNKEDIMLIAGKGHESYQIIQGKKYKFDDSEIVKENLNTKA